MGKEIMIRDLTFSYGGNGNQLEHISLDIAAGEVIVMTGPSGSGKSSLTRVINGLIPYFYEGKLSGEVFVDGKPLKKIPSWERGKIAGNVFQDPRSQFFANEVAGEIAFGCENYGYSHEDIQNHVHRAAADIKIQDILDHSLHSLSYGMRQKVAIASAEAIDPEIYVMDEPSANLDIASTYRFADIIRALKQQGKTIIIAEHRLYYLMDLADRFLCVQKGKIVREFTAQQMKVLSNEEIRELGLRTPDLHQILSLERDSNNYYFIIRGGLEMAQQNKKQPKAKTGLARCLELASGHKGLVFLAGFLAALAAICSFVPYLSIYYIIREILFVYPDMSLLNVSTISTWGWLTLAGILGNIVFYFFALLCSHVAAFGTLYELKVAFADHIMHIPLGYHLTLGSGKMRKIMDENIESVEKFIAHQLPDFVASLVAPLVLVIILLGIDWRYGVVCLVGIVLAFIVQFAGFNGEAKEKMHRFQTAQENMNSASVEYVRGMSEIKAFNQTADSFKRLSKSITDYTSFVLEYALGWQNCMPAFTTIINNIYLLLIPVGVLIGMHTTDFREYSLTFIFYLIIVHAISGVLNKIMYISESFTQIDGSVERMDEILRIPVLPEKSTAATIENYGIAFRDVSFSYEADSQVKALSHVSFFADQGKVTAIVGPSGGGKSTIASLISRFYDVTDGSIQIGGVDIRDIPLDALMDKVSFVFQDTFLFKQSILDNIRMGNPDATEEQVIAAAKAARCHEFIEQLPNGYQTVIGSTGVHLSGGERQRIAIARAIVKDAPIIVLDEATAFSDPENEYLIQKAFEKLIQNKTVVMIAHRLSTIRNADQILVMEKGCLIESGTHDELLKKDGKYAQMWSSYTESINWKIGTGKAV